VALSAAGQVLALVLALRGHGLIDLRVFRSLPPALRTGRLYEARLVLPGREMFPLPFSYPPFAALLFLPLSWMPWVAVAAAWDAASVACLAWLVHWSLRLTGRQESMGERRCGRRCWCGSSRSRAPSASARSTSSSPRSPCGG
jgi:alpha-1,2-mannosyltransferase